MTRYRIVRDNYAGYEAQFKVWFWPFWLQCFGTNTSRDIESSKLVINRHKGRKKQVVWEEPRGRS